jgi:replicative DNA helicase
MYPDNAINNTKITPHSLEAEQAVLGGLMLDNAAWDLVIDRVSEADFYFPKHRLIYRTIAELSRRDHPFDVVTLAEALKEVRELDNVGGDVYLFELAKNTPSAANIAAYGDIVRERSILRQLIRITSDISSVAFNPSGRNSKDILEEAESKIFKIAEQESRGEGPIDISSLLNKATTHIDALYHSGQETAGLATGFRDLDNLTSGFHNGDLVVIAGRPSMGKTAFAINIAEHAAIKASKPVLVFSMEMPGDSLATRMISSLGRVDQHRLRTGKLDAEDWPRINSAVSMLAETPLLIDDTPALNPAELRARARRVAKKYGQLGLIVIDYMQLMQIPGYKENRTAEISEISRSLKNLAKELKTPVLALSQLNRSLEQRNTKRPVMSDLRESGAIEQDADVILFIYRDEVYHENSPEKGIAEIIIAKQRNGPIGTIKLTFLGRYTRFENFAQDNKYLETRQNDL